MIMKYQHRKYKKESTDIKVGMVLVAKPFVSEPLYKKTVILIVEHNSFFTRGIVLNKSINNMKVVDFLIDLKYYDNIYMGGLSDLDKVFWLHTLNNDISEGDEIINDLFFLGDFNEVKELANLNKLNKDDIKFFIGIVEWDSNELYYELQDNNKWWVTNITSKEIFNINSETLWSNKLLQNGHIYGLLPHIDDPELN